MTTRIEHDLLGEREIPNDAYWGIHTLRAVENFKISKQKISDIPEFVRGMVMVKKATARANAELGVISAEVAAAIDAACDEVDFQQQIDIALQKSPPRSMPPATKCW